MKQETKENIIGTFAGIMGLIIVILVAIMVVSLLGVNETMLNESVNESLLTLDVSMSPIPPLGTLLVIGVIIIFVFYMYDIIPIKKKENRGKNDKQK